MGVGGVVELALHGVAAQRAVDKDEQQHRQGGGDGHEGRQQHEVPVLQEGQAHRVAEDQVGRAAEQQADRRRVGRDELRDELAGARMTAGTLAGGIKVILLRSRIYE
jgi:hypothetical protein